MMSEFNHKDNLFPLKFIGGCNKIITDLESVFKYRVLKEVLESLLFGVCCLLFVVCCSLFVVRCLLFVVCCLLFVVMIEVGL